MKTVISAACLPSSCAHARLDACDNVRAPHLSDLNARSSGTDDGDLLAGERIGFESIRPSAAVKELAFIGFAIGDIGPVDSRRKALSIGERSAMQRQTDRTMQRMRYWQETRTSLSLPALTSHRFVFSFQWAVLTGVLKRESLLRSRDLSIWSKYLRILLGRKAS
jgi:hypothetical protein